MSKTITESAPIQGLHHMPSESEHASLARLLFEHIENQIKAADSKAWLTIAANGILATLGKDLISGLLGKDLISGLLKGNLPSSVVFAFACALAFIGFMFVAIVFSLWYAVKAVKPELIASDNKNLFFFRNIARSAEPAFIQRFNDQTREGAHSSLLGEVHAKATIAERKFSLIQRSLSAFFFALVFGAISLALGGLWRLLVR